MPPSHTQLKSLTTRREKLFRRVQEIYNVSKTVVNDATQIPIFKARFAKLEETYREFDKTQDEIMDLQCQLNLEEVDNQQIRAFEELYYHVQTVAEAVLVSSVSRSRKPQISSSCLPKISLVSFDGNFRTWKVFHDSFRSLIHDNDSLSKIEKFHHLLASLSGAALGIARSLPLTELNYDIVWNALVDKYENKRILGTELLDSMLSFNTLSTETASSLNGFLEVFYESEAALRALEIPDLDSFILLHLSLRILPRETRKQFEIQHIEDEIPTFEQLVKFVRNRVKVLEMSSNIMPVKMPSGGNQFQKKTSSNFMPSLKRTFVSFSGSSDLSCPCCKNSHTIFKCSDFLSLSPADRRQKVQSFKLCFNCLKPSHRVADCSSKTSCLICNFRHHTLLHYEKQSGGSAATNTNMAIHTSVVAHTQANVKTVLLGTALIHVKDKFNRFQPVRALIDSGAQTSFLTSSCAQRLGLPMKKYNSPIAGLGQAPVLNVKGCLSCLIKPRQLMMPQLTVDIIVIPEITSNMPSCHLPRVISDQFMGLDLADPYFDKPSKIDLLLGADVFPEVYDGQRMGGRKGSPTALHSIFGWVITGRVDSVGDGMLVTQNQNLCTALFSNIDESSLDSTLTRFWEIEDLPKKIHINPDNARCEQIFKDSHYRNEEGRYVVPLPFKTETNLNFGNTYDYALSRLHSLERRLARQPTLRNTYCDFLQEYEKLGHMEQNLNISDNSYFIPHHCVIKDSSSTTKLRVVFDASARAPHGSSLNDLLLTGPKLQKNICDVVTGFRLHDVVFTADICKMYRQVLVRPEDHGFQNILWRDSPVSPVKCYKLRTVTYGVSSAPYLAIRALHQLAYDEGSKFPLASEVLLRNTYVDDIVSGASNLSDALLLRDQLIDLLSLGGFQLRKWTSNSPQLLAGIPEAHRELSVTFDSDSGSVVNLLGLQWDALSDSFKYKITPFSSSCTKRSILSHVARLFDPLGWLTPVVFRAKCLLQTLWRLGAGWDEPVPADVEEEWSSLASDIVNLSKISIERHVLSFSSGQNWLVGFSDASERGYGAVVYLVIVQHDVPVKVSLLVAKSRVAPLKVLSVPRLELCGAVLLSRLLKHVLSSLAESILITKTHAFSDSSTVLSWLTTPPHTLKSFVANRVVEIIEGISQVTWHHVASGDNPADCASRGLFPTQMLNHPLWWSGAPWLMRPIREWPLKTANVLPATELPEVKTCFVKTSCLVQAPSDDFVMLEKFSKLVKLKRVTAWCLRFIFNARAANDKRKDGPLSSDELQEAFVYWIKLIQLKHFKREMDDLSKESQSKTSLSSLCPWVDPVGLLRVGGRLSNSDIGEESKYPILLPKSSHLINLLIDDYHTTYLHVGPRALQALLSRKYWIIGVRNAIRSRLSKCIACFKIKASPNYPRMSALPSPRVVRARPFINVGVDFGGPFIVKESKRRNAKTHKCYLALFVCMCTKAVHLEVVSDLSTEAFLAAFNRFVARRGLCLNIYSDCGTNFVGARRHLSEMFELFSNSEQNEYMVNALSMSNVKWHFNPPYSPHFGGLWEAGIRSAKYHLKRVIGTQVLTFEEYSTLFARIEAVMNSRPLCQLSTDPREIDVLTPGHFLIGSTLVDVPESDIRDIPVNRLNRWQLLRNMYQHFWSRWSKEYLHTLQQRNKWNTSTGNLKLNDLVVLLDKNLPPSQWRLGKIEKTLPGPDGVVRVAEVRTSAGIHVRPVVKLCPLPID